MLFTMTLPARIQFSASLLEHNPARAIRLAIRSEAATSSKIKEGFEKDMIREVEHKKEGKNSLYKTRCCFFSIVLSLPSNAG